MQPFEINEDALAELPAKEREELKELLSGVQAALKQNPLNGYSPYPKQKQFHTSPARTRMFVGGNRAGKTTTGVVDDLIQALPPDHVPKHLLPYKKFGHDEPFHGRVIVPDLVRTMGVLVNKFRTLVPKEAIEGREWGKAFDKTRRVLRFEHGSTIDFMSTEQDPDKFGGVDLHRVHYDEEPDGPNVETIWQESRWRLLDHGGDQILTMTPLFGVSSLVHDQVWDRRNEDNVFAIQSSVWDNPHISRDEISEAMEGMTEEEKKARVYGEFVHFAGLFFDEFEIARHVQESGPTPQDLKSWDVIVGIDPGLERSAITWVAFDNDNHALVFAELYPHDTLIPDIAHQIRAKNLEWGIDPMFNVIDPAARIRDQIAREQIQSAYEREGIPTIFGQNERGPGILEMKRRLQQDALHISPDCTNLIWEFGRYRKDPNSKNEFDAIKKDDHLLDSLRYVCMERPWGPLGPGRGDPQDFRFQGDLAPRMDQLEAVGAGSGPPIPS